MVRLECWLLLVLSLGQCGRAEDRVAEAELLRNIPPELSVGDRSSLGPGSKAQARFLPFSASFSLSAGGNNAHTFSVAGSPEGVGLSQSASHGSASNGIPGSFSASQSSSIAAGLGGLSASDSSSFASNDPLLGPQAQAHGNAFSVGQGSASAHGHGVNGQASSGAQSSVDGIKSEASSNAQNLIHLGSLRPGRPNRRPGYAGGYNDDDYYYYNSRRMPTLTISVNDRPGGNGWYNSPNYYDSWRQPDYCNYYGGWYRDPHCRNPRVTISKPVYRPNYGRGPYYDRLQDPRQEASNVHYSTASATSSAQSGPGGFAHGQSASQAHRGQGGPSSSTSNEVQSSGDGVAHAQGASNSVQQVPGGLQASLNSASIAANSRPGGSSSGSASAGSSGSRVTGSTINGGSVNGAASSGGLVVFPGPSSHQQIIPQEFVRSARPKAKATPVEELVDELADAVYDVLDE